MIEHGAITTLWLFIASITVTGLLFAMIKRMRWTFRGREVVYMMMVSTLVTGAVQAWYYNLTIWWLWVVGLFVIVLIGIYLNAKFTLGRYIKTGTGSDN